MYCTRAAAETGNPAARPELERLGVCSAAGVAVLLAAYALTLAAGLLSLESPEQPIGDPLFGLLEVLILALMPPLVTLLAAVHAWAPARAKTLSLSALVFTDPFRPRPLRSRTRLRSP